MAAQGPQTTYSEGRQSSLEALGLAPGTQAYPTLGKRPLSARRSLGMAEFSQR